MLTYSVGDKNHVCFDDVTLSSKDHKPLSITVSVKGENLDFQSNLEFTSKEKLQGYLTKILF